MKLVKKLFLPPLLSPVCGRMPRFNIWMISRYSPAGVFLKGNNFLLFPYDEMDDDELKWVWLFKRGEHKIPDNEDKTELNDFDLTDYGKDENDLCEKMASHSIEDDEKKEKKVTLGDLMIDVDVSEDLISVTSLLMILTEQNCPDELMMSLYALIKEEKARLMYGESWVKMSDMTKRLTDMTTPVKKKMTDFERKKKMKKIEEEKEKRVVKMGIGDTAERIGEVMRLLKESVDVKTTSSTTIEIDEMERVVWNGMDNVDTMIDYVTQIDSRLAHSNNMGMRLVTLRGQIFTLYSKMNPNATNVQIGEVFGVSSGVVSTSMGVAHLVIEYPAFGHVTLPFTVVARNLKRIRKWMLTASDDDKIFWGQE